MTKNDDLPSNVLDKELRDKIDVDVYRGVELRDWFAGIALQGLTRIIRNEDMHSAMWDDLIASKAYRIADAMLAERGKE